MVMLNLSLYFVMLLSGGSALIYESLFNRYFTLHLGSSSYSQALVLCIFMLGITLGSLAGSKYSKKIANPLKLHSYIEISLGCLAILFHPVYLYLSNFGQQLITSGALSFLQIQILLYSSAILLMLPQSFLLGLTFPLISCGAVRNQPENSNALISNLYATNSIGGSIAILLVGFIFISKHGLPGSMLTAAAGNILAGVIIFITGWFYQPTQSMPNSKTTLKITPTKLLYLTSFTTGFAMFGFELAWTRILSFVLGSSNHAFEIMLSAFILGIAIGSYYSKKHQNPNHKFFGIILGTISFCSLISLVLLNHSIAMIELIKHFLARNHISYYVYQIFKHLLTLTIILPTTFFSGLILPLTTNLAFTQTKDEKVIGKIYAYNTIGAILAICLGCHYLMPLYGSSGLIKSGSLLFLLLSYYHMYQQHKQDNLSISYKIFILCSSIIILTLVHSIDISTITKSFGHAQNRNQQQEFIVKKNNKLNDNLIYHKEGKHATISVYKQKNSYSIATNGKIDASISLDEDNPSNDEQTQTLLASIPLSLRPNNTTAAVIGFGSGMTSETILSLPQIQRVDTIEIEPEIVAGAKLMGNKIKKVFNDPRSNIIFNDARIFFQQTPHNYDLIVSEPSNLWVRGIANLYSIEFYQTIKNSLSPQGILAQWIHIYELNINSLLSVINSIKNNFNHVEIFLLSNDMLITASQTPIETVDNNVIHAFNHKLTKFNINSAKDVGKFYLSNADLLVKLFAHVNSWENSDFYPRLEQEAEKHLFFNENTAILAFTNLHNSPIPFWLNSTNIQYLTSESFSPGLFKQQYSNAPVAEDIANAIIHQQPSKLQQDTIIENLTNSEFACSSLQANWVDNLIKIIYISEPWLSGEQMHKLLTQIKPNCKNLKNDNIALYFNIFYAILHKDYTAILSHYKELTKQQIKLTEQSAIILKTYQYLALIKLQRYQELLDEWQETKKFGFFNQAINIKLLTNYAELAARLSSVYN